MLISYCVPVMNRTYDLKVAMGYFIESALLSPPVELVIINYGSKDDLDDYVKTIEYEPLMYKKYEAEYYHMAHARNLTIRAATGEYILISSADVLPKKPYFSTVRERIDCGNIWLHHHKNYVGVICCQKEELVESGGFDERFEFYGKEDKDLLLRLRRRGKKHEQLPRGMLGLLPTSKQEKFKNYRPGVSSYRRSKNAKAIYLDNIQNNVLVANQDIEWGVRL